VFDDILCTHYILVQIKFKYYYYYYYYYYCHLFWVSAVKRCSRTHTHTHTHTHTIYQSRRCHDPQHHSALLSKPQISQLTVRFSSALSFLFVEVGYFVRFRSAESNPHLLILIL